MRPLLRVDRLRDPATAFARVTDVPLWPRACGFSEPYAASPDVTILPRRAIGEPFFDPTARPCGDVTLGDSSDTFRGIAVKTANYSVRRSGGGACLTNRCRSEGGFGVQLADSRSCIDFHREINKHIAFGGGAHRCLGSHLARMELRVALEEWHLAVPEYRLVEGIELRYSQGLRSIDNLELIW